MSHVASLLLIVLLGSGGFLGCHTTTAVHSRADRLPDSTILYHDPDFRSIISPVGWGIGLAVTAGGAYAGYRSGYEHEWNPGAPAYELPGTNALIGGVLSGLTTMLFTGLTRPERPSYNMDQAEFWLSRLDDDLVLLDATDDQIRAIDRRMEWDMVPRDTGSLGLFVRAFPESRRTDSLVTNLAESLEREKLAELDSFIVRYRNERGAVSDRMQRSRERIGERYVDEADDLAEAIDAAAAYPEQSGRAEQRAAELVVGTDDLLPFARAFPSSPELVTLVDKHLTSITVAQIDALLPTITDEPTRALLVDARIDSSLTVGALVDVADRYPSAASRAEEKAASLVRTTGDLRRFLRAFPHSEQAEQMRGRLAERLKIPESVGTSINTDASEYGPVITPDGSTLYFTRRYTGQNRGDFDDEDIWVSDLLPWGTWSSARNLRDLNDGTSNSVNSVTPDGNTLLLHGAYGTSSLISPASLTHRTSYGWSSPKWLDIEGYYNLGGYIQTFLANDGRTLLLALERTEGRGEHDLYVSFLRDDKKWTTPRNLGRTINTRRADDAPFLASDGRTLYFASAGHGGEGGSDLFMSRRLDDSWTKWTKPKNLGRPINTPEDDSFFFIPASGDVAYFSSDRSGEGLSDIFSVALPEDRQPLPVVLVIGTVLDRATGDPVEATIVYEDLATGREIGRARTDPATGLYKLTLPPGANYGFRAEAPDYLAVSDNIDLSELRAYREQTRDLELVPIRSGETIRLNNLFFDFGRSTLRPESHPELRRLAAVMNERPSLTIEIIGHTDSIGVADDNLRLSRNRADAVARYLVSLGIPSTRLATLGRGEENPVSSNETEEGRMLNRRVEVRVE